MWIFLIILFTLSCVQVAVNLSLFTGKRSILLFCFSAALVSFLMFPFSIQLNFQKLALTLNDFNVLALVCTYQIVESILVMILSLTFIRAHYKEKTFPAAKAFPLLPPGVFLAGIFFGQTYLFNVIDNVRFYLQALSLSLLIGVILFLSTVILKKLFLGWEWRMELKIILSFSQIILAMFLPLLLMGLKIQGTQLRVDIKTTLISLLSLILIVFTGFYWQLFSKRREVL